MVRKICKRKISKRLVVLAFNSFLGSILISFFSKLNHRKLIFYTLQNAVTEKPKNCNSHNELIRIQYHYER